MFDDLARAFLIFIADGKQFSIFSLIKFIIARKQLDLKNGLIFNRHCAIPRKIAHPSFIPFNQKTNRLEPAISETHG